jgi:hypothetical protein
VDSVPWKVSTPPSPIPLHRLVHGTALDGIASLLDSNYKAARKLFMDFVFFDNTRVIITKCIHHLKLFL